MNISSLDFKHLAWPPQRQILASVRHQPSVKHLILDRLVSVSLRSVTYRKKRIYWFFQCSKGFGAPAVSSAPSFGGFGTTPTAATTSSTGFSFAQPTMAQPTGLGSFGQSAAPTTGFGLGSAFGNTAPAPTTSGARDSNQLRLH